MNLYVNPFNGSQIYHDIKTYNILHINASHKLISNEMSVNVSALHPLGNNNDDKT